MLFLQDNIGDPSGHISVFPEFPRV